MTKQKRKPLTFKTPIRSKTPKKTTLAPKKIKKTEVQETPYISSEITSPSLSKESTSGSVSLKKTKSTKTSKTLKKPKTVPKNTKNDFYDSLIENYKNDISELSSINTKLLNSLQKENEELRSSDASLFKRFLGISIKRDNNIYEFTQEVKTTEQVKTIKFILEEIDDHLNYKLLDYENVELSGFLLDEICFKEEQVNKFFSKVFSSLISKSG